MDVIWMSVRGLSRAAMTGCARADCAWRVPQKPVDSGVVNDPAVDPSGRRTRHWRVAPMSAWGHSPNACSALALPVPPGADMVGKSGASIKPADVAWWHHLGRSSRPAPAHGRLRLRIEGSLHLEARGFHHRTPAPD